MQQFVSHSKTFCSQNKVPVVMPSVSTGSKSYLGYLSLYAKQSLLCPVYEVVFLIISSLLP